MEPEAPRLVSESDPRVRGLLATRAQVTATYWLRSRVGYALTLRNVSMHFHLARWTRMLPAFALVVALAICAGSFVFSWIRPAGVVTGSSKIVMDRDSGQVYVSVNQRLYPALNLSSARLIVGNHAEVTSVNGAAVAGHPIGPRVGIEGAPDAMAVSNGDSSSVGVCQRLSPESGSAGAVVTLLDGGIVAGDRAGELGADQALLGVLEGRTYLVWNGMKAVVDPSDRIVLGALGIDPDVAARPMPLGGAVGNAIPSNIPLSDPVVPAAGAPTRWRMALPAGAVIQEQVPGAASQFYVVLVYGIERVSPTVAAMLRSENAYGLASAPVISPDALAGIPEVEVMATSQFPPAPVTVVTEAEHPVTCWVWEKGRGAGSASARVLSGTNLPIAAAADVSVVPVVSSRADADSADAVYMGADAANWVAATGNGDGSSTRESLWWLSPSGNRFGVAVGSTPGSSARSSLGLDVDPLPMPWSVLRLFPSGLAPGVALSKDDAMTEHDSVPKDPAPGALVPAAGS